jgi:hypothetical protein
VIVPVRFAEGRPLSDALRGAAGRFATVAASWTPSDRPHVWVFDLRSGSRGWRPAPADYAEAVRAEAMRPVRRAEFLTSRLALRALIQAYAPGLAPPLRFACRPGGKPLVRTACGARCFRRFNVSHSHGVLAVAIVPARAPETEVGVDLEVLTDGGGELSAWVSAEARLKCIGVGLGAMEDTPDVMRASAATSVADLRAEWRGRLGQAGPSVCSGWPELELALAWSRA